MKSPHPIPAAAAFIVAAALLALDPTEARDADVAGPVGPIAQASTTAFAPRSDAAGGVTVKVTPRNLSAGSATWDFEVVLDTHSADLGQDLVKVSVLIDSRGREHAPTAWTGDPPGGHHREGVLSFKPPGAETDSVTLRIKDVGGVPQRSFRWLLKDGAK